MIACAVHGPDEYVDGCTIQVMLSGGSELHHLHLSEDGQRALVEGRPCVRCEPVEYVEPLPLAIVRGGNRIRLLLRGVFRRAGVR